MKVNEGEWAMVSGEWAMVNGISESQIMCMRGG